MTVRAAGGSEGKATPENVPPAEEGVEASVQFRRGVEEDLKNARKNGQTVIEFNVLDPAENRRLKDFLGRMAEANGSKFKEDAEHYQGRPLDTKFWAKVQRVANARMQVKTVAIILAGTAVIVVGWELIAWAADINFRMGWFGEKNTPKLPLRRVA